ncbi:MAG: hypothetical protein ACRC1K_11520, partial [Planctomycetia bacterium]
VFESPWPLVVLLCVAAAVTAAIFAGTQRDRWLWATALLLASTGFAFLLDGLVETSVEAVDARLDRMAAAALRGDAATVIAAISPRYDFEGVTFSQLSTAVDEEFRRLQFSSVSLNGRTYTRNADGEVFSSFVAVVGGGANGVRVDRYPLRLRLIWRHEAGDWKIRAIERFQPVANTGERMPLFHH